MIVRDDNPLAAPSQAKHTLDGSAGMAPPPDPAAAERRILLGSALAVSAVAFIPAVFAAAGKTNMVSQHFLLSSAARTFSLMALCQLSDEDAYNMFRRLRWPDNDGAPVWSKSVAARH